MERETTKWWLVRLFYIDSDDNFYHIDKQVRAHSKAMAEQAAMQLIIRAKECAVIASWEIQE